MFLLQRLQIQTVLSCVVCNVYKLICFTILSFVHALQFNHYRILCIWFRQRSEINALIICRMFR